MALFGNHGASIGLRSRGIDPSRVGGDSEAKSISREGTFAADVIDSAHLHAVLRGFCESVGTQLRRSGRRARTVSLKLRYEDFTTVNRSLTPGQPISSDEAIYEAADTLLTRLRSRRQAPGASHRRGPVELRRRRRAANPRAVAVDQGRIAQRHLRHHTQEVRLEVAANRPHRLRQDRCGTTVTLSTTRPGGFARRGLEP